MIVKEACIVMVINKETKSIDILEVVTFSVVTVFDFGHALTRTENVTDSVVHWVVEQTSNVVLVWSNVSGITIEALTHLEDASRFAVLSPKIAFNLRNSVNTNTIEVVIFDQIFNPVFEVLPHI